jgi:NAD(P)-dependent dehydrogenase (short-subunit alcohol dehydrogenase family)
LDANLMTTTTASITAAELTGQTALVTGATSGIGKAAALRLAGLGATVVVHGRDAGRGTQAVEEIELLGGQARFVAADLSDPAAVAHLVAEVGRIDILVNNAHTRSRSQTLQRSGPPPRPGGLAGDTGDLRHVRPGSSVR